MTFGLRTLFIVTTLIAVFLALVFAAPLPVMGVTLIALMLISPSFWVSGSVFCRGGRQAFFLGGFVAGILPFVIANYIYANYLGVVVLTPFAGSVTRNEEWQARLIITATWFAPGLFSFAGGGVSYLVYRLAGVPQRVTPVESNKLSQCSTCDDLESGEATRGTGSSI